LDSTYKNILLIGGTGRNSGKSTLACKITEAFCKQHDVIAIKISPHFHQQTKGLKVVESSPDFNVFEETSLETDKDSSRMLVAGATKVYFIQVFDAGLLEAFKALVKHIPTTSPVICESPALIKYITPGLFFIADHPEVLNKKKEILSLKNKADGTINIFQDNLEHVIRNLGFSNGEWSFSR